MTLPVKVFHGRKPGPVLFVSAAVHGDEIIGVEIVRRLSQRPSLKSLAGTLLLIPVVNGYGYLSRSRYLPDRRDLNRSFPGSGEGSLADRLAEVFLREIVARADFGIDIHSAAIHRMNLPQVRIAGDNPKLLELAKVFGAPAILFSSLREGSLRKSAADCGVPLLLFEGGEGLRFDETAIRACLAGTLRVLRHTGMITGGRISDPDTKSVIAKSSYWLRAPEGGLLRLCKSLGDEVRTGERVGVVSDLFGETEFAISAKHDGIVVGRASLPVVNEGDAILHIARVETQQPGAAQVTRIVEHLEQSGMFYEDEII